MAATANTQPVVIVQDLQLKRSKIAGEIPLPTELIEGEIAINSHDGKAFLKKDSGQVIEIGRDPDLDPYVRSIPKTGQTKIKDMVGITQVDYDAITTKDPHTLYVIL